MYKRDFTLRTLEKLLFFFFPLPTFEAIHTRLLSRLVYQPLSDLYGRLADLSRTDGRKILGQTEIFTI